MKCTHVLNAFVGRDWGGTMDTRASFWRRGGGYPKIAAAWDAVRLVDGATHGASNGVANRPSTNRLSPHPATWPAAPRSGPRGSSRESS